MLSFENEMQMSTMSVFWGEEREKLHLRKHFFFFWVFKVARQRRIQQQQQQNYLIHSQCVGGKAAQPSPAQPPSQRAIHPSGRAGPSLLTLKCRTISNPFWQGDFFIRQFLGKASISLGCSSSKAASSEWGGGSSSGRKGTRTQPRNPPQTQ